MMMILALHWNPTVAPFLRGAGGTFSRWGTSFTFRRQAVIPGELHKFIASLSCKCNGHQSSTFRTLIPEEQSDFVIDQLFKFFGNSNNGTDWERSLPPLILLRYEEDDIRAADIEKVESIIMQKKPLSKNSKDVYESDGNYETHITILYK